MKTIIAGSRDIIGVSGMVALKAAIKASKFNITEVVSGTARGVDSLGITWAHALNVPVKKFPAKWEEHGKRAGFIRNAEMADYADALIAVWDGQSRGTKHMIDLAREKGLKVSITYVVDDSLPKVSLVRGTRYMVVPL